MSNIKEEVVKHRRAFEASVARIEDEAVQELSILLDIDESIVREIWEAE